MLRLTSHKATLITTLSLVATTVLSGCGDGRSAEAFCDVMDQHRERYEEATQGSLAALERGDMSGLLEGSAGMVSALGDLQMMWDELADVAPEEIRSDVEVIRDSNRQQLETAKDAVKDPLGALTNSLTSSLMHSGSYTRVNDYAGEHCGSRPF